MSNTLVLGCMWGDEAKAKIVDYLAEKADFVVRFQGGSNAGHTIVTEGKKYVFHTIPSGIMFPQTLCLIGAGVLIDPAAVLEEIKALEKQGINLKDRLLIDFRAGLVLPLHKELDAEQEGRLGDARIGTTKRGIGPAYSDYTARTGLRLHDLQFEGYTAERLQALYRHHHKKITKEQLQEEVVSLSKAFRSLKKYVGDVELSLYEAHRDGSNILFEGAQGALLDNIYGNYPFVTSSRVMTDAVGTGTGFSARYLDKVIGVYKAYCTRVGEGPFVTEIKDELAETIRKTGNEYGATTGRPRRIGWFDTVAASYSARLNKLDCLAITCLDVLSGLPELKLCVAHKQKGRRQENYDFHSFEANEVSPVYETFSGWEEDISGCRSLAKLPLAARRYLVALEDYLETKVEIVSVGKDRKQTFTINRKRSMK
ncbi:adenylosuccinate synthase [Candidatus Cloacimonadaceae bacterium]